MIALNDTVSLIETTDTYANGKLTQTETGKTTTIFASVGSIGEREFYDATQAGIELTNRIIVWTVDYNGERILTYGGQRYHVERTYNTRSGTTELSCRVAKGRG